MGGAASSPSPSPSPTTTIKNNHLHFPHHKHRTHLKKASSLPSSAPSQVPPSTAVAPAAAAASLPSNSLTNFIQQETHHIRCKILNDIPLSFTHPTIIILYGPPLSNCHALGSFIISKFSFPSFSSDDEMEMNREEFFERIQSKDCEKGFLLINLPKTVTEGEEFNLVTKQFKKVVLLLEQDFTVRLLSSLPPLPPLPHSPPLLF
jgi:hypothetical protein